jgi:hypothetical protein
MRIQGRVLTEQFVRMWNGINWLNITISDEFLITMYRLAKQQSFSRITFSETLSEIKSYTQQVSASSGVPYKVGAGIAQSV